MSFRGALASLEAGPADLDAYDDLARASLAEGEEEVALPVLLAAAEKSQAPLLFQWAGLLRRSIGDHQGALVSFARAVALAPADAGIAHGHARIALEAGLPAIDLFLRARALAPSDGDVLLGLAAARNAAGDGLAAADELEELLEQAPGWIQGHEQLAQLLSTLGKKERVGGSLERAIARFPGEAALWSALFGISLRREDYTALSEDVSRARSAGMGPRLLDLYNAIVAAELDTSLYPKALFDVAPSLGRELGLWRIRHLLRLGAVSEAIGLIDEELASDRKAAVWPYAAIAWRLAGDERSQWLEGDDRLVKVFDLTATLPDLGQLAATLRSLHVAKGEYVDQSVRGGTQTDGPLLSRIDPLIRKLRTAIIASVEEYVRQLPKEDLSHPLLSKRRDRRVRFSGSWSVKLQAGGRHTNHVHPQGWISSALYISLPPKDPAERQDAGWFTLGEPQEELKIPLEPRRKIEPQTGHLVLFPSWMWHGTVPFSKGERLTVAFDVSPPI
ncbi:MAG TPA: putative 2OG-Fe(II) oxygenase [Sphingomicrobium sp.]|nr:putative 2OG-Fe(II) oxygenase [Sphingomicrobium sp.]